MMYTIVCVTKARFSVETSHRYLLQSMYVCRSISTSKGKVYALIQTQDVNIPNPTADKDGSAKFQEQFNFNSACLNPHHFAQ